MYLHKRLENNKGLSLVEVLVSVFILTIVALPLLNMFANTTKLVVTTNTRANITYVAKAQIESLYNQSIAQLFATADLSTKKSGSTPVFDIATYSLVKTPIADTIVAGSGKYVTVSAVPTGNLDHFQWSTSSANKPVYAYLIVNKNNTVQARFIGPDGIMRNIADINQLDESVFNTTTAGVDFSLKKGGSVISGISGKKPAGRPLVLIVNSVSVINPNASTSDTTFVVHVSGSMYVQHFKPVSMLVQGYQHNFSIQNDSGSSININVYSNDNTTPSTIPVNVTCAIFPSATGAQESITQNTLEVFIGS